MANLSDSFSDAAVQDQETDAVETVSPAFNRAVTEKDTMTTDAAVETPAKKMDPATLETARIVTPREELSDEAYAAVKRGDAVDLKSQLGVQTNGDKRAEDEGFTQLQRAVQEGETEQAHDRLLHEIDPDGLADAGVAEMVLAETNGNVEAAQILLDQMEEDELDDSDDDIAEERAIERGNMSIFLALLQRQQQRRDFNAAAEDDKAEDRKPDHTRNDGPFTWFTETAHAVGENVKREAHALAAAFGRAKHRAGQMSHQALNISNQAIDAALAFCSTFFHLTSGAGPATPTPDPAAQQAEQEINQVAKQTAQAVAKILAPEPTQKP